jgi:hypothetical protein
MCATIEMIQAYIFPKVPEFISQRRRWLNGSLFASIHSTVFFYKIWTSGQNIIRKFVLQIEFIYNAIQLLFTWTSLANFYLAFFFVSNVRLWVRITQTFNLACLVRHYKYQRCVQLPEQRCWKICVRNFPRSLHRYPVCRSCLFTWQPTSGSLVCLLVCHDYGL